MGQAKASCVEDILALLRGVKAHQAGDGWEAFCPAHDDTRRSLGVGIGKEGQVLFSCGAGCSAEAICSAIGKDMADLWPGRNDDAHGPKTRGRIVTTYPYFDESGVERFQVCRMEPKDFRQRRQAGIDGWAWALSEGYYRRRGKGNDWAPLKKGEEPTANDRYLKGVEPFLYRLPELLASPVDQIVWLPEGEKDVEALIGLGLVATTNPMGAEKWRKSYSGALKGRKVVILPDNDDSGRRHAEKVSVALDGIASSVTVLALPDLPAKGDVSDWLAAHGAEGAVEHLLDLADSATPQLSSQPEPVIVRLADVAAIPVSWLWHHWLPDESLAVLDGDPGLGKSTLTLDLAARVSRGWAMPPLMGKDLGMQPAGVLLLGAEDSLKHTVRPRLDSMGADCDRIHSLEAIIENGSERLPCLPWDMEIVVAKVRELGVRLIIVDPLMAYLSSDCDAHKDQDVRRALRPLSKLAESLGVTILLLRHLNKLSGGPALYRGGSSIGISACARASLIVGRDPDNMSRYVLAMNKCNLCPKPTSLAYRLESSGLASRIVWEGETALGPNDILGHGGTPRRGAGGRPPKELGDAIAFLRELLADGPVPATEVFRRAALAQHAEITINRAKKVLEIKPIKDGKSWYWLLPKEEEEPLPD